MLKKLLSVCLCIGILAALLQIPARAQDGANDPQKILLECYEQY